jgi:hypothetical protein
LIRGAKGLLQQYRPGADIIAAQQNGLYSITSSARTRRLNGNSRPSPRAAVEIEHQLELCRQLDRQVAGVGSLKDAIDIDRGTPILIEVDVPVAHQTAGLEGHGSLPIVLLPHPIGEADMGRVAPGRTIAPSLAGRVRCGRKYEKLDPSLAELPRSSF